MNLMKLMKLMGNLTDKVDELDEVEGTVEAFDRVTKQNSLAECLLGSLPDADDWG